MNTKRLLWWLIAGTRGGANRARIISALHERPYNANQLAELLKLDYKTIRHHLSTLTKHEVIIPQGDGYGAVYFLTVMMEDYYDDFNQIWVQFGKTE
ncbi:MAG: winged helix-turn-helix domain-containing protein [Candidatus Thorarchaeota archaeon]